MTRSIGIIGLGKVGKSLVEVCQQIGELRFCVSKSFQSDANKTYNYRIENKIEAVENPPEFIFIAVNDANIAVEAERLAKHFKEKLNGKYIIHLSAVLRANILHDCEKYGAISVAAHPFQTFFYTDISNFDSIAWGIECDKKHESAIAEFIHSTKGKPFFLDEKMLINKAVYHTIAISASNYLSAVLGLSSSLADVTGISKPDFLLPIIKTTIANNINSINNNSQIPITGPIVRADISTINQHIIALESEKELKASYCYFGLGLLELLKKDSLIDENAYNTIKNIFMNNNSLKSE